MGSFQRTPTRNAVSVLLGGWMLILGLGIVFGFAALGLCWLTPAVYQATSTLYVTSGTSPGPTAAYEDVMGSQKRVNSYARLVYSEAVLGPAIKAAGLNIGLPDAKKAVGADFNPDTVLLTVSAKGDDPEVAQRLANAVADSMVERVSSLEAPSGGGPPLSRLTALAPATVDPDPVFPKTSIIVPLAVVGGLLVGVGVVLIWEKLNNSLRDEDDLERVSEIRPLASIPTDEDLELSKLLDFGVEAAKPSAAAFRHLRNGLTAACARQSITKVLVTSAVAEEGKSTVAINLAAALAEGGNSVVLVDTNLRAPVVADRTGVVAAPGLAEAVYKQLPLSQVLQSSTLDGLTVVSAGRADHAEPADLLASSAFGTFLGQLSASFDYVIVDSPGYLDGPDTEAALPWVDGVLLVGRRGTSKLSDLRQTAALLSDAKAGLMGVVFNASRPTHRDRSDKRRAKGLAPERDTVVGARAEAHSPKLEVDNELQAYEAGRQ